MTNGRVTETGGVAFERERTDCGVVEAPAVVVERNITDGCVVPGTGVIEKRAESHAGVIVAGGGVIQRRLTKSGVVDAVCKAKKRIRPLSSVAIGIAAIGCRSNSLSRRRQRKKCDREHEGNKSFLHQTITPRSIDGKKLQDSRIHRKLLSTPGSRFLVDA